MRSGSRPRCRACWLDRSWGNLQRLEFLEDLGDFGGEQARVGPSFLDRAGIALHFVQGAAAAGHGPERRPCQEGVFSTSSLFCRTKFMARWKAAVSFSMVSIALNKMR